MAQFYLLSVLLNVLAGLILVYGGTLDDSAEEGEQKNGPLSGVDSKVFRLVVGILSAFVGVMKLLTVFRNDVPVIGDLLPAIAGLCGGAALLVDYYVSSASEEPVLPQLVQTLFVDSRKYLGIACIAVGVLHFVFPQVVLL